MPTRPARRPVGAITRGTTNPNRLRRVDRWIGHALGGVLRAAPPGRPPVVVDLGYGAAPVTVLELAERLRRVRQDVRVVGVEIDPERVERGRAVADPPRVDFVLGGFEVPLPAEVGASAPTVVRAFNVLRQYDESEVAPAWEQVVGRLAPGGALVEGTCDELGRLAAWVDVRRGDEVDSGGAGSGGVGTDPTGTGSTGTGSRAAGPRRSGATHPTPQPRTLTLSWRLAGLESPSVVAERLPKVLIHRNVPGEPVHDLMGALERAWERSAPLASFGARQRFVATVRELREAGWPVRGGVARWRLGELTVDWSAVAPSR